MLKDQIATQLGLPMATIELLGTTASHRYVWYTISKRGARGIRTIYHPAKELKAVQRWLLREVIEFLPMHETAKAYRPGASIRDNASTHVEGRYLLRMDFRNFFPSITASDIQNYINNNAEHFEGWDEEDIEWFISVICRHGKLTIGAPTSPGVSNAVCYDFDKKVASLCAEHNVSYTRYADDLFFSTKARDILGEIELNVVKIVKDLTTPSGLRINEDKTHHSSKRQRRVVTGLILTSDGKISVGRSRKRHIRSMIHKYENLADVERKELAGMLSYIRDVEPSFIDALAMKYTAKRVNQAMRFTAHASS